MDDQVLRRVESEVLDQEHKQFGLLRLPEDLAITRLLKIRGDIGRNSAADIPAGANECARHAFATRLSRATSHCLRWILTCCPPGPAIHGPDWVQEEDQAVELLNWGLKYTELATQHVAWSNSLIGANAVEERRLIVFDAPREVDVGAFAQGIQSDLDWWKMEAGQGFPYESFERLFDDWQRHAELLPTHLDFSPQFVRSHNQFPTMRAWIGTVLFPELAEDVSLGQYDVGNLRNFFTCIYTICLCVSTLEDEIDRRVGQNNRMGSWTFQLLRPEFVEWLTKATDLASTVVDRIVADMTLNPNRFHCAISATPFILSRSGRLFLLPRAFTVTSPQRSFATAMTSGSARRAYECIGNLLEGHHLGEIERTLLALGLRVTRERTFTTPDGKRVTPDFIVTDGTTPDCVVVDFKNALAATAVNEVTNRLKEYRKGVEQVERYIDTFRRFPEMLAPFSEVAGEPRIGGLLLFRLPIALPVARHAQVAVDNWFSLQRRLLANTRPSARDLILAPTATPEWAEALTFVPREIVVANWTYRYHVIAASQAPVTGMESAVVANLPPY